MVPPETIARHQTAIQRTDFSRPIRIALETHVIGPETSVLDYGCGRGGDVGRLEKAGIDCVGWDPHYRPNAPRNPADVVNLGFVLNVIEDPEERDQVLRDAWRLAERVLLVATRPTYEARDEGGRPYGDGILTERGTFQRFFEQSELRAWVEKVLGVVPVSVEPGIVFLFREEEDRYGFQATRIRRISHRPRVRQADQLYEAHEEQFTALLDFYSDRGRPPKPTELVEGDRLAQEVGSIGRAVQVLRRVHGSEELEGIEAGRREDLLVFLALDRFGGRARFSDFPDRLRWDIRAHFSSYKQGCEESDDLLFALGNPLRVEAECRDSPIGKLTPDGLYIHRSALDQLSPTLRVYEGCARSLLGEMEDANIIRLGRKQPKVSYSAYPAFNEDPHPALAWSYLVDLQKLKATFREYRDSENPPILHRKELFLSPVHPDYAKFQRVTQSEVRHGLLDEPHRIGHQRGWDNRLEGMGWELRGHRLVRRKTPS